MDKVASLATFLYNMRDTIITNTEGCPMPRMRLDKMLAMLAVCPRSGAKALLRTGRVRVGGKPCADPGFLLDPNETPVTLDGERLAWKDQRSVMLNKPMGVLTAARVPRQQ